MQQGLEFVAIATSQLTDGSKLNKVLLLEFFLEDPALLKLAGIQRTLEERKGKRAVNYLRILDSSLSTYRKSFHSLYQDGRDIL